MYKVSLQVSGRLLMLLCLLVCSASLRGEVRAGELHLTDQVAAALVVLQQPRSSTQAKRRAANKIETYYLGRTLPPAVRQVAGQILDTSRDYELSLTAAQWLLEPTVVDMQDLAAIERNASIIVDRVRGKNTRAYTAHAAALTQHYGPGGAESLVRLYVADAELPISFRLNFIHNLVKQGDKSQPLQPESIALLQEFGSNNNQYSVMSVLASVHAAWGLSLPLNLWFKLKQTQNNLLVSGWLLCTGLVLLASIYCLVKSLQLAGGRRIRWLLVWLCMVLLTLVAFAIGVLGSLGHNSAPPPLQVLQANSLYFSLSLVFVGLALWLRRVGKKEQHA